MVALFGYKAHSEFSRRPEKTTQAHSNTQTLLASEREQEIHNPRTSETRTIKLEISSK